jgi:Ca2+-binding RTX toxin-like protein
LTYVWNFGDGSSFTGRDVDHTFLDSGVYTVTLTVSDPYGNTGTDTVTVTVNNLPPLGQVNGPTSATRGQPLSFTFTANDFGPTDQASPFTYTIIWGDGSSQTVVGPASGVQVEHVFTASGSYTVSATATDKDGATGPADTHDVLIGAVVIQGNDLVVGGTTGADTITVTPILGGFARVVINSEEIGTFAVGGGAGSVFVYGQAGNDHIELLTHEDGSPFMYTTALYGGDGNDTLDARASNVLALLLGGAGDDVLYGGGRRDILIGGLGADILRGGGDDDLLIGGTTVHDANFPALSVVASEWVRTDVDFATRVSHLNGSLAGGLNGSVVLTPLTIQDDGALDDLYGDLGQDWFFQDGEGATLDRLNDVQGEDLVTQL